MRNVKRCPFTNGECDTECALSVGFPSLGSCAFEQIAEGISDLVEAARDIKEEIESIGRKND